MSESSSGGGPAKGVTWDLSHLYAGPDDPKLGADLEGALQAAAALLAETGLRELILVDNGGNDAEIAALAGQGDPRLDRVARQRAEVPHRILDELRRLRPIAEQRKQVVVRPLVGNDLVPVAAVIQRPLVHATRRGCPIHEARQPA